MYGDLMKAEIEVPEDVKVELQGKKLVFEGKAGKVEREIFNPLLSVKLEDGKIILETLKDNKKNKKVLNTFVSHINNSIKGVKEGFVYELKALYSHFPMSFKIEDDKFIIKNFAGGRGLRIARILPGVEVKVDKQNITVSGPDLEKVSQTAANLENATRIIGKDRRIFQDGIYIIKKGK